MTRFALLLSFRGTHYAGWQTQPQGNAVQDVLQQALCTMTREPTKVVGVSRTDAGVHALRYIAHFDSAAMIAAQDYVRGLSSLLPDDIRVLDAVAVADDFDARHHGGCKYYRYVMLADAVCPPLLQDQVWALPYSVDVARMATAAQALVGHHDFTSFAAGNDANTSKERTIVTSTIRTASMQSCWPLLDCGDGEVILYEITGHAFLKQMVRNIVGALFDIGRGHLAADVMPSIIAARDRQVAGVCAPAQGLYLRGVDAIDEIFSQS